MQVVIDSRMILPQMTGAGRYVLELARALRDLPGDDLFELWLQPGLLENHPVWKLSGDRIRLRSLRIRHMQLSSQWVLPEELLRRKPDLFHYPHFDLPWLVPGATVATLYDLKYIARPDFFPAIGGTKRLAIILMMTFTARRARRIIAISENTRKDLIHRLGVPPAKIRVVPLGVNECYFQSPSIEKVEAVRERYKLSEPFILFVGERRPHKNIEGLLLAFNSFRRMARKPYHLVIAGKHYTDFEAPERLVQNLEMEEAVHFLDSVKDDDLPLLYKAADAFALLSFYEGFGLPVLEAMASGTPVVVSEATSLPEVAGNAGLQVPVSDPEQAALALKSLIPGGENREEMISRGIERARQFTWEECARRTLTVYREARAT